MKEKWPLHEQEVHEQIHEMVHELLHEMVHEQKIHEVCQTLISNLK